MGKSRLMARMSHEEAEREIQMKRQRRMMAIDELSPDVRALIHEYGYTVVYALLQHGIVKANHIRHIVETVLNEFSPTRGAYSKQGKRTEANFTGWSNLNDK